MWKPYPSCGVSNTNASGWKHYSGVLNETWTTKAKGIKCWASLMRAWPVPQDHRAWVASIKLPQARWRQCRRIDWRHGCMPWTAIHSPRTLCDFQICKMGTVPKQIHSRMEGAEICRSGSSIISLFFPFNFIVYRGWQSRFSETCEVVLRIYLALSCCFHCIKTSKRTCFSFYLINFFFVIYVIQESYRFGV